MADTLRAAFLPLVLLVVVLLAADFGGDSDAETKSGVRRPLLWMVEGSPRVFLYGTIHVPDSRVTDHLPVVQQALDQSTAVYTELPLDQEGMMAMQMAVMRRAPLPSGQTLKKLFGDELHAKVAKHLPSMAPIAFLENMKPWLIQILLLQTLMQEHTKKSMETQKQEVAAEGGDASEVKPPEALDPLLFNTAKAQGKQVGGLETIDAQLDAFDNLSIEKQIEMVKDTVTQIEKMKAAKEGDGESAGEGKDEGSSEFELDPMGAMVEMWLAGDDQAFLRLFEEEVRKQGAGEESFVEALLDKRNVGMVKKICELMKAGPDKTYFMAVGAGHIPGDMGIVKLMRDRGFKVRRLELGETLPAVPQPQPAGAGAGP